MPKPDDIRFLIIHETDSRFGDVPTVRSWHVDPVSKGGRGWLDIGYHYLIENGYPTYGALKSDKRISERDGLMVRGRDIDHDGDVDEEQGAHCRGYNDNSLGICLVGTHGVYTPSQLTTLLAACANLCQKYYIAADHVLGHYETDDGKRQGKECPSIDMKPIRAGIREALAIISFRLP